MIGDLKAELFRYLALPFLNRPINELRNVSAIHTNDVVVMGSPVELEYRVPVVEAPSQNQACSLKLSQHAIDRREADIGIAG